MAPAPFAPASTVPQAGGRASNYPDPFKGPGTVTSGRRTPEGNRLVGGVPNSRHLTGEAVDVVGADRPALQQYYGPNAAVDWHDNHWHVEVPGAQFPYYGRRGTTGLRGR